MEVIEVELKRIKPVSTNEMYSYGRKKVRKSNSYRAYESEVFLYIRNTTDIQTNGVIERFKRELDSDYRLAIRGYFEFYVPRRSYFKVDTSNYIKATEDIIKNLIGIDDSRNVSIVADKYLSKDKEWNIKIKLEIFQLSYEIPKDKWSKNILGNTAREKVKIKSRIKPIKPKKRKKIELTDRLEDNSGGKMIEIDKNIFITLLF